MGVKPLRIKLEKIQTKSRRTYTRVKVLDTALELPAESPTEKVNPDTGEVAPIICYNFATKSMLYL